MSARRVDVASSGPPAIVVSNVMIVRQFLQWMRSAPAAERADATGNLARAYLYSALSPDDRAAAEGALIMLLDDPSPLVRGELARALAFSENAPPAVKDVLFDEVGGFAQFGSTYVVAHRNSIELL